MTSCHLMSVRPSSLANFVLSGTVKLRMSSLKCSKFNTFATLRFRHGVPRGTPRSLKGRGPPRSSCWIYQHILDLLIMLIPGMYINRHRSDEIPIFERLELDENLEPGGGSLQAVLAACHGCRVGQRVLACSVDKINGFTCQLGLANCYRPRPGRRVYRPF